MAEPEKPAPAAATPADPPAAKPEKTTPPAAPVAKPEPAKPQPVKPTFQIYNRQKDQHVVGLGCWCLPKIEVVAGRKIIVHKRD